MNSEQHIQSMKELCRVAGEVRVYPLIALDGKLSKHLPVVIDTLENLGKQTSLIAVDYEFQKGATEMLAVWG